MNADQYDKLYSRASAGLRRYGGLTHWFICLASVVGSVCVTVIVHLLGVAALLIGIACVPFSLLYRLIDTLYCIPATFWRIYKDHNS